MQFDVWAINPSSNSEFVRASATIASSGNIALTNTQLANNGAGYKVSITSNGNESGKEFRISGIKVGELGGAVTTEVLAGPNTTTVYSANYYSTVNSISIDAASAGGVKIGYGGDLALPRTRIKSVYYVGGTSGNITFVSQASSSTILRIPTVSATIPGVAFVPPDGILTTKSGANDFCVVTVSGAIDTTIFCG